MALFSPATMLFGHTMVAYVGSRKTSSRNKSRQGVLCRLALSSMAQDDLHFNFSGRVCIIYLADQNSVSRFGVSKVDNADSKTTVDMCMWKKMVNATTIVV